MRSLTIIAVFASGCSASSWSVPVMGLDRAVLSAWGTGPHDVWFAGGGLGSGPGALALHYDGQAFTDEKPSTSATLWWVFGFPGQQVGDAFRDGETWLVGEQGTALRWRSNGFTAIPTNTTATLYGVWGAAPDDLWAVGGVPDQSSLLLHFDGTAFSTVGAPPLAGALFKVWGSSASDVFVVGQAGTILHYDGKTWAPMQSGADPRVTLFTVAGRAANDVYAVGGQGTSVALHYDGTSWAPIAGAPLDATSGLTGVSVDAATGDLALVGFGGAKLRRHGGTWVDDSTMEPLQDLHAAWLDGADDLFVVGGDYVGPPPSPRNGVIGHFGGSVSSTMR
jgi:hypothetical protein